MELFFGNFVSFFENDGPNFAKNEYDADFKYFVNFQNASSLELVSHFFSITIYQEMYYL